MEQLPEKIYPFKFLDPYGRDDIGLFHGRDEETEALYKMVFEANILVVYGASGTGKTSLVQCGLANKFQSYDWLGINIRKGKDLNVSLRNALYTAARREQNPQTPELSLPQLFSHLPHSL